MGRKGEAFAAWLDATMSNKRVMGRVLAEKVGVNDSAVSRWRAGTAVPAMDTLVRIAEVFGEEPLRLAVTAGLLDARVAHVDPLEPPAPTARREAVRRQLSRIKGLTDQDRRKLLETYEEIVMESE